MYSNSSYHYSGPSAPAPPARPSSSYDPYGDQYNRAQTAHLSPQTSYQLHPSSGSGACSRPVSFGGHPQTPPAHDPQSHRLSYNPASQSYPQPHHVNSPPATAVHAYLHPGGASWSEPSRYDQGRPSSSYDAASSPLDDSFSRMSMSPPAQSLHYPTQHSPPKAHSPSPPTTLPMTCAVPTVDGLCQSERSLDSLSDNDKLHWAQDVLRVLERHLHPEGQPIDFSESDEEDDDPPRPIPPATLDLLNTAIPIIISFTSHRNSSIAALACYLKAMLLTNGSAPDYLPRDPRQAFKDFEAAARGGESRGWYRLGRDYESVGGVARARDCFERGRARGDVESLYRLGMATLIGQLGFTPNPQAALPLLAHAATAATPDFPQPAYVYGMILAGEFQGASIPTTLIIPPTSPSPALESQLSQARQHLERAAYLYYPQAQYKLGYIYEHATLGAPYDPLMSVQWHSLASQGGDFEADMALSKWFLCGAEGCFAKNEELARTFAEKAARAGLGTGCFALGYYNEVGIGGRKDTEVARHWYQQAAKVGNPDALSRLAALSQPAPQALSLQDHQQNINNTLVRKHTLAQARSDHHPGASARPPRRQQQIDTMRIEAEREARRAAAYQQSQMPMALPTPSPAPQHVLQHVPQHVPQAAMSPQLHPGGRRPSGSSAHHAPAQISGPSPHMTPRPLPLPHPSSGTGLVPAMVQTYTPVDLSAHPPSPYTQPQSQVHAQGGGRPPKKQSGKPQPQTFAEMGFVSKPVQDDGCVIM